MPKEKNLAMIILKIVISTVIIWIIQSHTKTFYFGQTWYGSINARWMHKETK